MLFGILIILYLTFLHMMTNILKFGGQVSIITFNKITYFDSSNFLIKMPYYQGLLRINTYVFIKNS